MIKSTTVEVVKRLFLFLALGSVISCSSLKNSVLSRFNTNESGSVSNAEAVKAPANTDITVTVLGSGLPIPSRTQFGAAILVQAADKHLMFDCGRGCTTRLAQLDPKLITKVDHLFVTHLHSDHLMGIDDLLLNGWVQGRNVPLKTWGPIGTKEMMQNIKVTFKRDIAYRLNDGIPDTSVGLNDAYSDLESDGGVVFDEDGVKVTAFSVDHASIKPAYGYKIEYNGRKVVISGDTTEIPSLYEQGDGADVLMMEVISPSMVNYLEANFTEKQKNKVLNLHLTAEQGANIFNKAKPKLGVYYHTAAEGRSGQSIIDVTQASYDGEVIVSRDLYQIHVGEEVTVQDLMPNRIGK